MGSEGIQSLPYDSGIESLGHPPPLTLLCHLTHFWTFTAQLGL